MNTKNDAFSSPLLNMLNGISLPIAVYSASDFVIRYANEAFAKLWKVAVFSMMLRRMVKW